MQRLSIIIPTLDEGASIAGLLRSLEGDPAAEVLVVDGGSEDGTREAAEALGHRVLSSPRGLAEQLNRGAEAAAGESLLFLYADCRLPPRGLERIRAALEDARVVGGAFRLSFDAPERYFRAIALLADLRNRLGFGPFGDQGIFARRRSFFEVGAFRPERFLEDFDLVRRLRRAGRFVILPEAITASTRRWRRRGLWRTQLEHLAVSCAYLLGKRRRRARMGARADDLRSVR